MISSGREDISRWASRIDTVIANTQRCCVNRVVVVESTSSTMDSIGSFSADQSGVLLVASEQTNGRGQRGRQWLDGDRRTLPCTFAVNSDGIQPTMLSAIVGCAVHETLKSIAPSSSTLMIKWPNDIIVRNHDSSDRQDHKIAGILIEKKERCAHIGIGVNCLQGQSDWGSIIRDKAISLSELGAQISRLDLVCSLVEHLSFWLDAQDPAAIRSYYADHDAMIGTLRSFNYNNQCIHGIVEHIDPLEYIEVRSPSGTHTLPIAQTRHIQGDESLGGE